MRLQFIFWFTYLLFQSFIEYIWIGKSFEHWPNAQVFLLAVGVESILLIPKIFFNQYIIQITQNFEALLQFKSNWLKIILAFILSIIVYRALSLFVILPYLYAEIDTNYFNVLRILTTMFDVLTPVAIYNTIRLFRLQVEQLKREKILIRNKLETELNFLKTQTNPHFLFNSLNNIYGITRKTDPYSANAILKLSEILRYISYGTEKKLYSIHEELELIQNYIYLEELRYGNKLKLNFQTKIDTNSARIVPMLLLPIIENAFKYGVSESLNEAEINIDLNVTDENHLRLIVENTFEAVMNSEYSGIGYKNLNRILELSYKEYTFNHFAKGEIYHTDLFINLNSYENL